MKLLWILAAALALAQTRAPEQGKPPLWQVHFEEGRDLFEAHDDSGELRDEAEKKFKLVLSLNPDHAPSVAYLGFIALDRDLIAEARYQFERSLRLDPKCAEGRVGLASLDLRNGKRDSALDLLRRAVADQPANRLALSDLASTLVHHVSGTNDQMRKEAESCWLALIRLDPNDRDAHYDLAQSYAHFSQWPSAARHFREVLRIGQTPDDMDVWVYSVHGELAEVLEQQKDYPAAIGEWEKLIKSGGAGEEEAKRAKAKIEALEKRLASKHSDR